MLMILGVGTDLTEIGRVKRMIGRPEGDRFIKRILTRAELELALKRQGRLAEFVAGRFAAKEAVVKALGCGIGAACGLHDVEVLSDDAGRPLATISRAAMERLGLEPESVRVHLSITHTGELASAYAVLERTAPV